MIDLKIMRYILTVLVLVLALAIWVTPTSAITWGHRDTDNDYPYVGVLFGLYVIDGGMLIALCSGSLIDENVFLTAGHCAFFFDENEPDYGPYVSFEGDDYPFFYGTLYPVVNTIPHPGYTPQSQMAKMNNDVGIAILASPVVGITPVDIASEGLLDELKASGQLRKGKFTRVGYGQTLDFPPPEPTWPEEFGYRWVAEDNKFKGLLKHHIITLQNQSAGANGTCFGDSGGPVLWMAEEGEGTIPIVVGVTSWGDPNCVGLDVPYRIDTPAALDFIGMFITTAASKGSKLTPPVLAVRRATTTWASIKAQ